MKFIIDSFRYNEWAKAFPDAIIVTLSETPSSPTSEDIVYAHLTDFRENVAQSDFRHVDEVSGRIKNFREALILLAQSKATPALVFYGGDQLTTADEAEIKKQVNSISLPGYPSDRVEVFRDAISRQVESSGLREWAEKAERIVKLATKSSLPSDITRSFRNDSYSNDAALALRLMCEAWVVTRVEKGTGVTSIGIYAPKSADDWFRPFGMAPSLENAKAIAAQMGANQLDAEGFLESIITGTDPNEPICNFIQRFVRGSRREP